MADQPHYVFDSTKDQSEFDRLRLLESAFDPQPWLRLENVGVSEGWHCLEVGAGAGSIMNWLSKKVGSCGKVVAIDTNTRFLPFSRIMGMSASQLKERYIQTKKCTPKDIDIYRSFAEDPGTGASYYSTVCVSGQKGNGTDGKPS